MLDMTTNNLHFKRWSPTRVVFRTTWATEAIYQVTDDNRRRLGYVVSSMSSQSRSIWTAYRIASRTPIGAFETRTAAAQALTR